MFRIRTIALCAAAVLLLAGGARAQPGLIGKINLATTKGVQEVKGEWRYADVTTGVGPKKNEIAPKAHGTFDDSKWEVLKPETLSKGRGAGGYCWCWYRIQITIPDTVEGKKFAGGPVWFSTTVDDYGEIWVDGKIDLAFGKSGRGAVTGFNSMNRVRLQKEEKEGKKTSKRDAKPGDVFQIAVLGINGPSAIHQAIRYSCTSSRVWSSSTPRRRTAAPTNRQWRTAPRVRKWPKYRC